MVEASPITLAAREKILPWSQSTIYLRPVLSGVVLARSSDGRTILWMLCRTLHNEVPLNCTISSSKWNIVHYNKVTYNRFVFKPYHQILVYYNEWPRYVRTKAGYHKNWSWNYRTIKHFVFLFCLIPFFVFSSTSTPVHDHFLHKGIEHILGVVKVEHCKWIKLRWCAARTMNILLLDMLH